MRVSRHLAVIALAALLAGCAQNKAAPTAVTTPQTHYSQLVASNEDITFEIVRTALPGDKDYVPQTGGWIQYMIKVKNTGPAPLHVSAVHLVDGKGIYRE